MRGHPSAKQKRGPGEVLADNPVELPPDKDRCPSNKEIDSLPERISFRLLDRDTHERRATRVVDRNISNTQVNARIVGTASRDSELTGSKKSEKNTGSRQPISVSYHAHLLTLTTPPGDFSG